MIVFAGKSKNLTRQTLTLIWLKFTRSVEPLESVDFSEN